MQFILELQADSIHLSISSQFNAEQSINAEGQHATQPSEAKMRRRGVGIGAVRKKQEQTKQFTEVGDQLAESQMAHVTVQLEMFKTNLEQFAVKYKNNIKKDPEFRKMFQIMCARIGVDPLASKKGFWSELLDVGDFYYELAVQIIEVCIITRCVPLRSFGARFAT